MIQETVLARLEHGPITINDQLMRELDLTEKQIRGAIDGLRNRHTIINEPPRSCTFVLRKEKLLRQFFYKLRGTILNYQK